MPPLSYEEFLRREREPPRMGQAATILIFLAMFFGLQWAWEQAHETAVERLVIDQATVKPSAWLAGLITPEINPYADGARLKAQGGGINILNGCEGTDVLFLLIAAFSVAPLFLRQRLWGLLLGVLLVYVFNGLTPIPRTVFVSILGERNMLLQGFGLGWCWGVLFPFEINR